MTERREPVSKHADIRDEFSALQNAAISRAHALMDSTAALIKTTETLGEAELPTAIDHLDAAVSTLRDARKQLEAAVDYRSLLRASR